MTDKNKIGKPAQAPDMADLLEYFETRSRALDKEGQPMLDPSTLQFMSLIKFNGVSILPPVLNDGRREEMISYKHEALRREKITRVRKTEELQAKVQSIVAGVEERRAAKQASKSIKTSASSSPSSRKSSSERTTTSESTSKVTTRPIGKSASGTPSEIIINISGSSKDATSSPSRSSSKASPKSVSSASTKSTMSPSRSASHSSSDAKKKDYTNYKSLSKLGALSKQKSFSSQHLDKSGVQLDSSKSVSRDLLPHPPVGRPPSRGSMRQSSSTPDLRSIDHAVKKEELVKPIKSGRSLSPKGGRPQAPERDNVKDTKERPESRAGKTREKEAKGRENKTKQEVVSKTRENVNEQKSRKSEMSMKKASDARTTSTSSKTTSKTESDGSVHSRRKAADPHSSQIHNPLEALEQELSREDENEKRKRLSGSSQGSMGDVRPKVFEEVRQELDPIQTATAELFPFLISEEQAMATLDSLQPEFASLEQQDSLPKDYNGIPLTSLKQQQIIHMLTKLSKALNMEETLTSTTSTAVGGEQPRQDSSRGSTLRGEGDYRSVHEGAIGGRGSVHSEYAEGHDVPDEMSVNMTADSSYHNSSNTSAHSRARMSPTGSSILSSASSVSGSRRMSPKSLKNTVHFSTLVTEISTSASQSYEDKISYRKLDITPKNSENFEDQQQMDESSQSRNIESEEMTPYSMAARGSNLLSKVALSPSVDTSSGSPGEFSHNHPFDTSNQESDLNTSDKENEYIPVDPDSSDDNYSGEMNVRTGRNQPVLNVYMANMPAGPIGENHPAVVHVKSSVKSELSDGSTLKESSDKVLQENVSRTNMKLDSNNYYGTSGNDFENLIQGKHSVSDSITSMQEEITRSYMMSQMRPERDTSDIDELKKQRKVVRKKLDIDDSVVLLQPVVFTNTGNSLQENRSMLEEEERIRNNLDRVHFEDSDTESDDDNVENAEHLEQNNVDNAEHPEQITVDNAEHPEQITVVSNGEHKANMNHIHVTEPSVNNIRETNDDCDDGNDDQNDESSEEEEEDAESEVEESEGDEEEPVQDTEVDDSKPYTHTEIDEADIDVIKVQEVDEHTGAADNEVEKEEEAKAEHIQRYLNQVHEQSLHHDDNESVNDDDDVPPSKSQSFVEVMDNIGALIGSFTANIQSMNHLSQEELFQMQSQQFELIQQKLIEHQRAQLEELFVAQRREQMSLEKEIEAYHMKIESDVQSPAVSEINLEPVSNLSYNAPPGPAAPVQPVMNGGVMAPPPPPMCSTMNPQGPAGYNRDPLKPRISNTMPQVTQAWQAFPHQPVHSSAKSPPFTVQPVASTIPYHNPNMSFNTSYSSVGPYQDPRLGMAVGMDPRSGVNYPIGYMADPNISSISHNTSYSTIPHRESGMLRGNIHQPPNLDVIQSQDPGSSHTGSNPFIYPSSPSLYVDPKDRDNVSEVSGFAKATPKQLMFSNQSTPVQPGRPFKPIQHSPVKQPSVQHNAGPYHVPDKVFHPSMHHKFSKVTAAVRGYLTRRLLRTPKVQEIIKTIADTRNFAFSFQAETPIKKGNFSREDRILLERIVNQLQAALLDIHEIFFLIPISERMAIIASSRQLEEEKIMRTSQRRSMDNVSRSQPKLSKATLKAMERKKKAQLAEESVFGSMELRPKSAPPATSSPLTSTDISGPLRRHYHSLFVRALRPLQGQISPIGTDRQITVREMKERPRTATEKRKSGEGSNKTRKSTGSKTTKTSTNSTNPVKHKSSKDKTQSSTAVKDKDKTKGVNAVSKTRKSEKSWR